MGGISARRLRCLHPRPSSMVAGQSPTGLAQRNRSPGLGKHVSLSSLFQVALQALAIDLALRLAESGAF